MTNEQRLANTIKRLQSEREIIGWSEYLDASQHLLDFGVRKTPEHYVKAELEWYNSMSLNIDGIKAHAKLWKDICATDNTINSNYGWCIFSKENGSQYDNVIHKLKTQQDTRQGTMIYTRPSMHKDAIRDGMKDFMCTCYTQSFIRNNKLKYIVHQRSCDFIYGFFNDFAWHCYVYNKMLKELNVDESLILYICDSLHIYPKHYDLLNNFIIKNI